MKILGKKIGLFLVDPSTGNSYLVGYGTGVTLNIDADMLETAGVSLASKSYIRGRYGFTIEVQRLWGNSDTGIDTEGKLIRHMLSGEPLIVSIGGIIMSGNYPSPSFISGSGYTIDALCYVSRLSANAPVEGYANISVTLHGDGDIEFIYRNS